MAVKCRNIAELGIRNNDINSDTQFMPSITYGDQYAHLPAGGELKETLGSLSICDCCTERLREEKVVTDYDTRHTLLELQ